MALPPLQHWNWGEGEHAYSIAYRHRSGPPGFAPVVFVHGFGASSAHWRFNLRPISAQQSCWAIDLLGFGASSKPHSQLAGELPQPGSVLYGFDLWGNQLADFVQQVVRPIGTSQVQLVGNSIGGLVVLRATQILQERGCSPKQVVLLNCAQRQLDDKNAASLTPLERWSRPLVKRLVRQRALLKPLFASVARPVFVRQVLSQAYPSGTNLDDELVELLVMPSRDKGAVEAFRGFVNLFSDHIATELLHQLELPVRLLWGAADPWEPLAEAERWAKSFGCIQELAILENVGHCPHDEAPEKVNPILLRWLA